MGLARKSVPCVSPHMNKPRGERGSKLAVLLTASRLVIVRPVEQDDGDRLEWGVNS
jgi:hypothetical protein